MKLLKIPVQHVHNKYDIELKPFQMFVADVYLDRLFERDILQPLCNILLQLLPKRRRNLFPHHIEGKTMND